MKTTVITVIMGSLFAIVGAVGARFSKTRKSKISAFIIMFVGFLLFGLGSYQRYTIPETYGVVSIKVFKNPTEPSIYRIMLEKKGHFFWIETDDASRANEFYCNQVELSLSELDFYYKSYDIEGVVSKWRTEVNLMIS